LAGFASGAFFAARAAGFTSAPAASAEPARTRADFEADADRVARAASAARRCCSGPVPSAERTPASFTLLRAAAFFAAGWETAVARTGDFAAGAAARAPVERPALVAGCGCAVAFEAPAFFAPFDAAAVVADLGLLRAVFTARPVVARATGSGFETARRGDDALFAGADRSVPDLARADTARERSEATRVAPVLLGGAPAAARAGARATPRGVPPAGVDPFDAGVDPFDAGVVLFDAGAVLFDAGVDLFDAGVDPVFFAAVLEVTCRTPLAMNGARSRRIWGHAPGFPATLPEAMQDRAQEQQIVPPQRNR